MPAARSSIAFYMKDVANNVAFDGATYSGGDTNTIGYTLNDCESFGVLAIWENGAGTNPVLDLTVEWSPNGGDDWYPTYPTDFKTGTDDAIQAHIDQIDLDAADGSVWQQFKNFLPLRGSGGVNMQMRVKLNFGGTSPAADLTLILVKKFNS